MTLSDLRSKRYTKRMMASNKTFTPLALANTFIQKHGRESGGIEHMKLQKLVYFAYGWWLAFQNRPLLSEKPQVWKYGPVFHSLYGALKSYGANPITEPQKTNPFKDPEVIPNHENDAHKLIDWIWAKYSPYSAITLSNMTHKQGTPWRQVAEEHGFRVPMCQEIPDNVIQTYFKAEAGDFSPS